MEEKKPKNKDLILREITQPVQRKNHKKTLATFTVK
jgi:hypothetical protein